MAGIWQSGLTVRERLVIAVPNYKTIRRYGEVVRVSHGHGCMAQEDCFTCRIPKCVWHPHYSVEKQKEQAAVINLYLDGTVGVKEIAKQTEKSELSVLKILKAAGFMGGGSCSQE